MNKYELKTEGFPVAEFTGLLQTMGARKCLQPTTPAWGSGAFQAANPQNSKLAAGSTACAITVNLRLQMLLI